MEILVIVSQIYHLANPFLYVMSTTVLLLSSLLYPLHYWSEFVLQGILPSNMFT